MMEIAAAEAAGIDTLFWKLAAITVSGAIETLEKMLADEGLPPRTEDAACAAAHRHAIRARSRSADLAAAMALATAADSDVATAVVSARPDSTASVVPSTGATQASAVFDPAAPVSTSRPANQIAPRPNLPLALTCHAIATNAHSCSARGGRA